MWRGSTPCRPQQLKSSTSSERTASPCLSEKLPWSLRLAASPRRDGAHRRRRRPKDRLAREAAAQGA